MRLPAMKMKLLWKFKMKGPLSKWGEPEEETEG
jgi:hypothetical protein